MTAPQLVQLLLELADSHDDVRRVLESRATLASSTVRDIVISFREELAEATAERGWRNHWNGEGFTPDYSVVGSHLEALLEQGEADLVLQLGLEVLAACHEQIEYSNDEGETSEAVREALTPLGPALRQSSLSPARRLLWWYDCCDEGYWGVCPEEEEFAPAEGLTPDDWNEVAQGLLARLQKEEAPWRRSDQADRLAVALGRAGREQEGTELALREARAAGRHIRVVTLLVQAGRLEEARAAAYEGLAHNSPHDRVPLCEQLRSIAWQAGDQPLAAAFTAHEFFLSPSLEGYQALRQATEPLDLWPGVREQTLEALENADSPLEGEWWPLPSTGLSTEPQAPHPGPPASDQARLLTEIALEEGRHGDALQWYARVDDAPQGYWRSTFPDEVATAVADTHPDEAIAIWKAEAESLVNLTSQAAYEASLPYLRKVARLLTRLGRAAEWDAYLVHLRLQYKRKRNFIALLSTLSDRPILEQ